MTGLTGFAPEISFLAGLIKYIIEAGGTARREK